MVNRGAITQFAGIRVSRFLPQRSQYTVTRKMQLFGDNIRFQTPVYLLHPPVMFTLSTYFFPTYPVNTAGPITYRHSCVLLCLLWYKLLLDSCDLFSHNHRLASWRWDNRLRYQRSNPESYWWINQGQSTTKYDTLRTVCIFVVMYSIFNHSVIKVWLFCGRLWLQCVERS